MGNSDSILGKHLKASSEIPDLGDLITVSALRMNKNAKYFSMFRDGAEERANAIADMQLRRNYRKKNRRTRE